MLQWYKIISVELEKRRVLSYIEWSPVMVIIIVIGTYIHTRKETLKEQATPFVSSLTQNTEAVALSLFISLAAVVDWSYFTYRAQLKREATMVQGELQQSWRCFSFRTSQLGGSDALAASFAALCSRFASLPQSFALSSVTVLRRFSLTFLPRA